MNTTNQRVLTATAKGYKTRKEKFNGREHIVVPVVALVEGVIQAMNAGNPEFVAAEEFEKAPEGWNGRPIFVDHPLKGGVPVFGNQPDILETRQIGIVFNAAAKNKKLMLEAWIDVERAKELEPELLERVQADEEIEISVGLLCATANETGKFNGKSYKGAWKDLVPDHLALLSKGHIGACSREMGCGVRAASKKTDKTFGGVFARMMGVLRGAQAAEDMSSNDLMRKLSEALRKVEPGFNYPETYYPVQDPNRVVYNCYEPVENTTHTYERAFTLAENGEVTLGENRVEVEGVLYYEPVLMNTAPDEARAAIGRRNSAKDQAKIQAMHDHSLALGASCEYKAAAKEDHCCDECAKAAVGNGCNQYGCPNGGGASKPSKQNPTEGMSQADRSELASIAVESLEGFSDENLDDEVVKNIESKLEKGERLTSEEGDRLADALEDWAGNEYDDIHEDDDTERNDSRRKEADKVVELVKKMRGASERTTPRHQKDRDLRDLLRAAADKFVK